MAKGDYRGQWSRRSQDLGKNKPKERYDYSAFKSTGSSNRYYSFTIKEHYDEAASGKKFSTMNSFLVETISKQKEREAKILAGTEYKGPNGMKEFIKAYTSGDGSGISASSNAAAGIGHLMVDWVLEQDRADWSKRQKMSGRKLKVVQSLLNKELSLLVDGFDDNFKKVFVDDVEKGRVPNIQKTKNGAFKIDSNSFSLSSYGDKGYATKTDLKKKVNSTLNHVRGDIAEYAFANSLAKASKYLAKNIKVTGKETRSGGQQVKADISSQVQSGDETLVVNLSSKAYQIKNPKSQVPVTIHDSSLQGIGEYMKNYKGFSNADADNFIFNFINIYNFVASGGVDSSRKKTVSYSTADFPQYQQIMTAVTNAAAMWFGTAILGKKGAKIFQGKGGTLSHVDFLVISGTIMPMSEVLEYIRDNANSIEIQFPSRRSMDALSVYDRKIAAGLTKGYSNRGAYSYPESILKVGRQYGRAAATASATVKFMYIANHFTRG